MPDPRDLAAAFAALCEAQECPDCNADTAIVTDGGLVQLIVMHDDTCPIYQRRSRGNTRSDK